MLCMHAMHNYVILLSHFGIGTKSIVIGQKFDVFRKKSFDKDRKSGYYEMHVPLSLCLNEKREAKRRKDVREFLDNFCKKSEKYLLGEIQKLHSYQGSNRYSYFFLSIQWV